MATNKFSVLTKIITLSIIILAIPIISNANSCRKAVVVYLDVSGSMYFDRHKTQMPQGFGDKVTLMEATVKFVEELFTNEFGSIVQDGDMAAIKQFYSQTATIAGVFDSFSRERDGKYIKQISKRLDYNGNELFDIKDSNHRSNPALARDQEGKIIQKTDFKNVIASMIDVWNHISLTGKPESFRYLTFIVITDGGHDASPIENLNKIFFKIPEDMKKDIEENRVKVLLFSPSCLDPKQGEYDIKPYFEKHLKAVYREFNPEAVDFKCIRDSIVESQSDNNRIEIKDIAKLVIKDGTCSFDILISNDSCSEGTLEEVYCSIFSDKDKTKSVYEGTIRLSLKIPPISEKTHRLTLDQVKFTGGEYTLNVIPYTSSGKVEGGDKEAKFEIKSESGVLWLAIMFIVILILGGFILIIMNKRT